MGSVHLYGSCQLCTTSLTIGCLLLKITASAYLAHIVGSPVRGTFTAVDGFMHDGVQWIGVPGHGCLPTL